MNEMMNAEMNNDNVAENNNGGLSWQASEKMEKRIQACLNKYGKERCAKGAWALMKESQIRDIHAEAKENNWPNLLIALHRFGCSDNQVNKIFEKHSLEPLSVRGKKQELSALEEIKSIDEQIKELQKRRSKIAQQAREEVDAEQQALDEKKALLNAVNE